MKYRKSQGPQKGVATMFRRGIRALTLLGGLLACTGCTHKTQHRCCWWGHCPGISKEINGACGLSVVRCATATVTNAAASNAPPAIKPTRSRGSR